MSIGRDGQPPIRVSRTVEMFGHPADQDCTCPGMVFEEGRGRGAAWVRFRCEHCGLAAAWLTIGAGDQMQRSTMLAGLSHTQHCWTKPKRMAIA